MFIDFGALGAVTYFQDAFLEVRCSKLFLGC